MRLRVVAVIVAGFLLAAARPPFDVGPLALVALAPLWWAWRDATPRRVRSSADHRRIRLAGALKPRLDFAHRYLMAGRQRLDGSGGAGTGLAWEQQKDNRVN